MLISLKSKIKKLIVDLKEILLVPQFFSATKQMPKEKNVCASASKQGRIHSDAYLSQIFQFFF